MSAPGCKGCTATVRLAPGEVERLVTDYLRTHTDTPLAPDAESARRLAICATCADLTYGTTCRHCGCLVELRVRLTGSCPAPTPRW